MRNKRGHIYTQEEQEFFKTNIYGHTRKEFIEAFKEKFGYELTVGQLKGQMRKFNLTTGHTGRFGDNGHYYYGSGHKMSEEQYKKSQPTMFKKGHIPKNRAEVGTEVIKEDGYIKVKVAQPNKWRMKHVLTWEAANGPIPAGSCLVFLDRDRANCDLSNLYLVTRSALKIINKNQMFGENPEVNRTMCILAGYMATAGISSVDASERGLKLRIKREEQKRKGQHNG